jgi:hypothetical protein
MTCTCSNAMSPSMWLLRGASGIAAKKLFNIMTYDPENNTKKDFEKTAIESIRKENGNHHR